MRNKSLNGQRSNLALLLSSLWAIFGLFIIIVGHLVIVFFVYGQLTQHDALAQLAIFLPFLTTQYLYGLAGLAIVIDVWVIISQKRSYEKQFKR